MRKSIIAAAALTLALTGAGAVGMAVNAQSVAHPSGAHSQQVAKAKAKALTISSFTFSPATLKVKPGQKIKVTNMDAVAHTVTSDDGTSFNVAVPAKSSVTFKAPATSGAFAYHCSIHTTMHGMLTVK